MSAIRRVCDMTSARIRPRESDQEYYYLWLQRVAGAANRDAAPATALRMCSGEQVGIGSGAAGWMA